MQLSPVKSKGWRVEAQPIVKPGAEGMRDPSRDCGMTVHEGDERVWSQGGKDESTNQGGMQGLED